MNQPILLPKSAFTRSLWKNGLGHTDQIAIEPPSADLKKGDYLWRISSATIAQASPFSVFPDHDRALVILNGTGLKLVHTDEGFEEAVELPPLEPYEFPGDIQSRCELLDGPVRDLSVFFRKGMVSTSIEVIRIPEETAWDWIPEARWNFLFSVRGNFEVCTEGDQTETLLEGDGFQNSNSPETATAEAHATYPVVPHGSDSVLIHISIWA